jgi:drug/metabolite transporter (DMT)-like permease
MCGVLSPGIVRLLYYSGLKSLGTAINSSVVSVYPLYTSLLAVVLLSEILSAENLLGIICIVVGIIFVDFSSNHLNSGQKRSMRKLVLPILAGLSLGLATIIRKFGLIVSNVPVLGVAIGYSFSLIPYALILMFSASTRSALSLKRDARFFWIAGLGQAVSWIASFYALSFERVSIVTPLVSIEPVFVVPFAFFYLKETEHLSLKLVASILLTVLGVVLVTI